MQQQILTLASNTVVVRDETCINPPKVFIIPGLLDAHILRDAAENICRRVQGDEFLVEALQIREVGL